MLDSGPVPVLLLPVGAVEPHGPHAPLRTDSIISTAVCERAAIELSGDPKVRALVLPEIGFGVTHYAAAFTGAVTISEETLHALIVEVSASLRAQGFRHQVIVNSHFEPAQVATLRRAAETAHVGLLDLTRRVVAEQLTEEFKSGAAHAGRYETSLVLATQPELIETDVMRMLPALAREHARRDGCRADRLPRDGHGPGVLRRACRGDGPRGRRDARHARRPAHRPDPCTDRARARSVTPGRRNAATSRRTSSTATSLQGRGDRTALIDGDRSCSYAEPRGARQSGRQRAARARRAPAGPGAAGAGRLRRVRRHVVRGAEDRRGHGRGVHVPAAQGLRVLRRLHRRDVVVVGRRDTRPHPRRDRDHAHDARSCSCSEPTATSSGPARCRSRRSSSASQRRSSRRRPRSTASRSGSSPPAVPASRRRASIAARSPMVSYDGYARGVLDIRADDIVLPVPKLFFGYARDLAALFPFGVGGAGLIFRERTTAELIFELIARHRPTILVNVPTMMQAMLDHPSAARPGPELPASLHVGRGGAPRTAAPPLERRVRRRGARRDRIVGGVPHLHLESAGRSRPGSDRRGRPGVRGRRSSTTMTSRCPTGTIGRLWIRGESAALEYWEDAGATRADLRGATSS